MGRCAVYGKSIMSDIKSEFDKVKEVSFDDIFNADMSEDPEPDKIQNPISYQKEIKQIQRVLEILLLLDKRQDRISADQKMECLENMEFCTDSIRRFTPAVIRKDDNTPLKALTDTWSDLGYTLEKDTYGIRMVMMERTKKKATEKEKTAERLYAMYSVRQFLLSEKSTKGIKDSFLKNQVLIFTHERTNDGFFDIDNLSTSYFINAISDVFLAGDTSRNLDLMQRYKKSSENRTVCHLVSREDYAKWVNNHY